MNASTWGAVAIVVAGLLGVWGSKIVADRSRAGNERSAEVQANQGIASGYSLLTSDLRADVDRLRADVDTIRADLDKAMKRYRGALAYIRLLLAFIADKAPGHKPPPPPEDLTLDLD